MAARMLTKKAPDVASSEITPRQAYLNRREFLLAAGIGALTARYAAAAEKLAIAKRVVTTQDLPAGRQLTGSDLTVKKPGTGIPAGRLDELVNRTLKRAVPANTLLSEEDLELV